MIKNIRKHRTRKPSVRGYDLFYATFLGGGSAYDQTAPASSPFPIYMNLPNLQPLDVIEMELYGTFKQNSGSTQTVQYIVQDGVLSTLFNITETLTTATSTNPIKFKFNLIFTPHFVRDDRNHTLGSGVGSNENLYSVSGNVTRSVAGTTSNAPLTLHYAVCDSNTSLLDVGTLNELRFSILTPSDAQGSINSGKVCVYRPNWM